METANIAAQNVEKIEALFPNCVTEALDEEKSSDEKKVYKKVVNFDMLRQMLTLIQGSGSNYKSKTTIINESGLYSLVLSRIQSKPQLQRKRVHRRYPKLPMLKQPRKVRSAV